MIQMTVPRNQENRIPELDVRKPTHSVHDQPGSFGWKLGKDFVVSMEMDPRCELDQTKVRANVRRLQHLSLDAVNITDNALGRPAVGPLVAGNMFLEQDSPLPILHFTTRDRSRSRLQSDLLVAHALGIRHVLMIQGHRPSIDSTGCSYTTGFSVKATEGISLVRQLNQGHFVNDDRQPQATDFLIGCVFNPSAPYLPRELDLLDRKIEAGAHFVMTQPIFDRDMAVRTIESLEQRKIHVLLGVMPLYSYKNASYMNDKVEGVSIPNWLLKRLRRAGANARDVGLETAQEIVDYAHERVAGAYIVPPFGKYEHAIRVLDAMPSAPCF